MDFFPRRFYLDDFFDGVPMNRRTPSMQCDVYEKENTYHIEMMIPGYKKEELKIEVDEGYIKVSAEKKTETNDTSEDKKYIHREISYGKVQRTFKLENVDEENIKAEFNDGILKLEIPKKEVINTSKIISID